MKLKKLAYILLFYYLADFYDPLLKRKKTYQIENIVSPTSLLFFHTDILLFVNETKHYRNYYY